MRCITLERYPNYKIYEDGTVVKISTGKTLKHTLVKNRYKCVRLVDIFNDPVRFNIDKLLDKHFKEDL